MNDSLFEKGYVIIDNFFTEAQTHFYMSNVANNIENREMKLGQDIGDIVHPMTWNVNSHPIWETVMWDCLPEIERVTNERLYPTYSFQRVYLKGANMQHHTDWPHCQISVTVNLGGSHPYPIYVTNRKTKNP